MYNFMYYSKIICVQPNSYVHTVHKYTVLINVTMPVYMMMLSWDYFNCRKYLIIILISP